MRITHRRRPAAISVALLALALTAACTASEASPQPGDGPEIAVVPGKTPSPAAKPDDGDPTPITLSTAHRRKSGKTIAYGGGDAPYNYAPSVLLDGGRYRMWWCSQLGIARPPGDDILTAEARSIDGPFAVGGKRAVPVFSGKPGAFDGVHTCDPSVIRVSGLYYMYYTGAAGDHDHGNAIGLATSHDGRSWTRVNDGKPLIRSARHVSNGNTYGAGQPSALYLGGKFYLMFTDTTGDGTGHNGAGQFVLRSPDATFSKDVEALGEDGFEKVADTGTRGRTIVDAFSADWMWVDSLAAFAIAHETRDGTTITFWDIDFRTNPYNPVLLPGAWREGPGLVRRPDGHAVVSASDPCGTVAIDLVRATHEGRHGPSDLRHYGVDVRGFDACRSTGRALLALDGFAMPSPQRTIDLVVKGALVRIDRRTVAEKLAVRVLDERVAALDKVDVAAHLKPGEVVLTAPERGTGFVFDDKLWAFGSADVAELNSSRVDELSDDEWDGYERGPDLDPPR